MNVYLAGGINGLSDSDAKDWRAYAKERLDRQFGVLDPMRRDYRGREDESVEEIVKGDLADIDKCQVILASCVRPSWGTAMELHYAATSNIYTRIYVVVPEGQAVSPWLRKYSSRVFPTFDEAIEFINKEGGE